MQTFEFFLTYTEAQQQGVAEQVKAEIESLPVGQYFSVRGEITVEDDKETFNGYRVVPLDGVPQASLLWIYCNSMEDYRKQF